MAAAPLNSLIFHMPVKLTNTNYTNTVNHDNMLADTQSSRIKMYKQQLNNCVNASVLNK